MFLNAIGIYTQTTQGNEVTLERIQYAQEGGGNPSYFFKRKENTETLLNPDHLSFIPGEVYPSKCGNEYNYFYQPTSADPVFGLSSKTLIEKKELTHLFANIKYIFKHPDRGTTLKDIIANPNYYTVRYLDLSNIQDQLNEEKAMVLKSLVLVVNRGESLESLLDKSIRLNDNADRFKKKIPRNSCC